MISCPTCGEKLSDTATICSSCGMEIINELKAGIKIGTPSLESQYQKTIKEQDGANSAHVIMKPEQAKASLSMKRGSVATGDIFYIGTHVIVGRFDAETGPVDVDLGVFPESAYVSRHHAKIHCDESGAWFLTDLGSNNGTFIWTEPDKSKRMQSGESIAIKDGVEFAFGNARFVFHVL
jgi:FHA domain/zinc-ribbon domain